MMSTIKVCGLLVTNQERDFLFLSRYSNSSVKKDFVLMVKQLHLVWLNSTFA